MFKMGHEQAFEKLTRHSNFSASTLFNHKLGLTNQHAGGNCVFRITRNTADSFVKAIALVRVWKVENLKRKWKNVRRLTFNLLRLMQKDLCINGFLASICA